MAIPVTPATAGITAIPDPKRSPQSYQAYIAKQTADAQQAAMDKSNAQIQSSYQPILDFYKKQEADTNARYAQNAANLKNIFGALTGLSAKDQANVKAQFESSITKQATDLATRTAEQRAAQAAGAAQATATGAERGGGPAMVGSPTATATEEAIGQSNAIQTNWAGLMNAQKLNALTDITNRGEGYSQQEIAATSQMAQNLQDALAGIGGQVAGIQGQIAQAKVARDQAIQNGEYEAAAAAQKQLDALQLQELKNQGSLNVAQTAAAARLAAAKSSGGGTKTEKLPASEQIKARADKLGPTVYTQIQTSANNAYATAFDILNPKVDPSNPDSAYKNPLKITIPKAADVKNAWQAAHLGKGSVAPLANDYIDATYG